MVRKLFVIKIENAKYLMLQIYMITTLLRYLLLWIKVQLWNTILLMNSVTMVTSWDFV